MVINPTKVMMETIFGSLIVHEANPIVMRRNENSLIWPSADQVKKLFFLVWPMMPRINIVINGLMISTNALSMITSGI